MILSLFRALDTVPISITNKLQNKERKKHTTSSQKSAQWEVPQSSV